MEESKLTLAPEDQLQRILKLHEQMANSEQEPVKRNNTDYSYSPTLTSDLVTDIIKIGSAIASISAILHLYGFGLAAKINILAYVSLTDYIKVAIGWVVPSFFIQFVVGFIAPDFFSYLQPYNNSSLKEPHKEACPYCKYENNMSSLLKATLVILDLTIILLVVSEWFNIESKAIYELLTFIGVFGWLTFIIWCTKSVQSLINLGHGKARLFLFGPLLLIYSVGTGLTHGAISSSIKHNDLVSITASNSTPHYGEMLFSFEKFIVIREIGHRDITFIPTDKISSIRAKSV